MITTFPPFLPRINIKIKKSQQKNMSKRKHSEDEEGLIPDALLSLTRTLSFILDDVDRLKHQVVLFQSQLDGLKQAIHVGVPNSKRRLTFPNDDGTLSDDSPLPSSPPVLRRSCAYSFDTPVKAPSANQLQWYDDFWSESEEEHSPKLTNECEAKAEGEAEAK